MRQLSVLLVFLFSSLVLAATILCAQTNGSRAKTTQGQSDAEFLKKLAESGNAPAQLILGEMHLHGKGLPRDNSEALRWFRAAAEQRNAEALRKMGFMYESGLGVERNPELAAEWYGRAMDEGDLLSFYKVGFGYLEEVNIP